jgi:hypothetical protein
MSVMNNAARDDWIPSQPACACFANPVGCTRISGRSALLLQRRPRRSFKVITNGGQQMFGRRLDIIRRAALNSDMTAGSTSDSDPAIQPKP